MNRNAESHFSIAPRVNTPRSIFSRPHNLKTTFDVGRLIPIYWTEVLPGQSTKLMSNKVIRTQPLVSAPMDNLYADTYYFYVPNRLVWSHWREFMGENTTAPWVQTVSYQVPHLSVTGNGTRELKKGNLPDYFGIPLIKPANNDVVTFNALYFRAYALIVREFFQDENLETPVNVYTGDNDVACEGVNNISTNDAAYVIKMTYGGSPYIVNKYHDYFTSALPGPLKSPSDILAVPNMPVIVDPDNTEVINNFSKYYPDGASTDPGYFYDLASQTNKTGYPIYEPNDDTNYHGGYPLNMFAVNGISIMDLRTAFQLQRLLERDAYGGTRYTELLLSHFGVHSPDASLQRPQYLGGKRTPINFNQVIQTSETGSTPQGTIAGYSLTSDSEFDFDASFTEHGMIIGVMCVRYHNSYNQGINKMMSRRTRYNYYFPELANISNQAIMKSEIYCDGSSNDKDVFGYQEAWAEYRYNPDIVTSEMRPQVSNSLASWHFSDNYNSAPTLSRDWMKVDCTNVDRALAVSHSVSNQLYMEIQFEEKTTLPMPVYSIPGLIDHN